MTGYRKDQRMHVAEGELARQAARIFPKLVKDFGYVKPLNDRTIGHAADYGVYTRRNGYRREVVKLDGKIVDAFAKRGWIKFSGDRYTLTDEGLLWLRRHRAGADPFRQQHQITERSKREVGGAQRPVVVNEGESPLGWLRRRKDRDGTPLISAVQYEAGERLRVEYESAQLMPSMTSNWDSMAPSRRTRRSAPEGPAALSDKALMFRDRVAAALDDAGPELASVLVDVCCHLVGLSETEKSRGWPQRSGKVILQIALTRLARHYGLEKNGPENPQDRTRMRHWGADDFRPSLDQWR